MFAYGTGTVRPEDGRLVLEASRAGRGVAWPTSRTCCGRHLERFGARRELVVTWERDPAGS